MVARPLPASRADVLASAGPDFPTTAVQKCALRYSPSSSLPSVAADSPQTYRVHEPCLGFELGSGLSPMLRQTALATVLKVRAGSDQENSWVLRWELSLCV
jgi:hypothetical protein